MKAEGRVGTIASSDGSYNPLRTATDGGLVTQIGGGKYVEAALAGRLFSVSSGAAVITTAALATNWKGLAVSNPTTSGKNYIILEFGWALAVVGPADGIVGLMTATNAAMTAAVTPMPAMNGQGSSDAVCDTVNATTGTPVLERVCGTIGTGATTTQLSVPQSIYDVGGSIILPPGRAVLTYTTQATTAAAVFYFLWEEVDI